jgi:O-acetyl-ADP-ribose deacetylase (regulator of RNase III)
MTKIDIVRGDITKMNVDTIVNAANKTLLGGGGVDGAIHDAAGHGLYDECLRLGGCETGEAKITKGYELPVKYVIHTVGPVFGKENGREAALLVSCYKNCLALAKKNGLRSIAFPAISTGVFGYPKLDAAKIAMTTVKDFIKQNPDAFDVIYFVLFNDDNFQNYEALR